MQAAKGNFSRESKHYQGAGGYALNTAWTMLEKSQSSMKLTYTKIDGKIILKFSTLSPLYIYNTINTSYFTL
jgi:hypothetical protein